MNNPRFVETGQPRFLADNMLIKLGKYLRILGYDAAWDKAARTHALIERANAEGRIFLTRNTRLADEYPPAARVTVPASTDPVEQLREVAGAHGLERRRYLFSRCVRCNVELDEVAHKPDIEARVHPNVFRRYAQFYTCPSCGTVFWKGSHVRNTCRKLGIDAPEGVSEAGQRSSSSATVA
ncbi:MAG: hypothetical protein FJ225_11535 [Lentisphaerae bacterium]|nr:hypothetical protein [Lentisphaerota bacterium]